MERLSSQRSTPTPVSPRRLQKVAPRQTAQCTVDGAPVLARRGQGLSHTLPTLRPIRPSGLSDGMAARRVIAGREAIRRAAALAEPGGGPRGASALRATCARSTRAVYYPTHYPMGSTACSLPPAVVSLQLGWEEAIVPQQGVCRRLPPPEFLEDRQGVLATP